MKNKVKESVIPTDLPTWCFIGTLTKLFISKS